MSKRKRDPDDSIAMRSDAARKDETRWDLGRSAVGLRRGDTFTATRSNDREGKDTYSD
jgi:hypothetical protein